MAIANFLTGLIHLSRPIEWTKSLANMLFAAALVYYIYNVQFDLQLFAIGFVSVALLWSGLYTLNDYSDRNADKLHPVKKERPIPSGKINASAALAFGIAMVFASFAIGFFLNNALFLLCLLGMAVNQFLYSHKPFSLKKRPVLDLISGSLVNPVFRFYSGWFLFTNSIAVPAMGLVYVLGLQYGGYAFYRLFSKSHEEGMNYCSSVVVFGEKNIKASAYFCIIIGLIAFILMLMGNLLLGFDKVLGYLPLQYGLLALTALPFAPKYLESFSKHEKADLSRLYRQFYLNYFLFVIGFLAIFMFFR